MPTMRAHLRSSDSVDFEHTETMRDMEELRHAEKEYVGPKDELPVLFSATYPGTTADRVPGALTTTTRTPRSNSKTSNISATSDKITVFRDNENDAPPVISKSKAGQSSHIENSQSITNPVKKDVPSTARLTSNLALSTDIDVDLKSPAQLRRASSWRTGFPRSYGRGPLHTCTTSAPILTTPSGPRHLPPNKAKRIPLGDQAEEVLVTTDAITQYVRNAPFFPATRVLQAGRVDVEMGLNGARKVVSRIPTKFGDESTQSKTRQGTPIRKSRAGSGSGTSRNRSGSKSRSRSGGRRPTTPGIAKSHEVPHIVARKKWDS
ncbi:hypothetical protein SNOG_03856 [Parastagonospora nodorum SN15]|uniref:Uncharacterized protein n=1 Tax=Phaeosphaeria nodorum (strain SN15 / ATCC MYA-4574 / FGSC 10173) TaxID=321614 RepID=Q0UWK8_PHANO|nr:hypothetical protein SNOG_03856 [Parastagonospora nodorum SN15]EAT89061.1 hypothetical protein SNOG_03856 [Parastagonospora nodorum SN15]